jgi:hypothetical protein
MSDLRCRALGCNNSISATEVFCQACMRLLETDTRRVLERTYKPGRRSSKAFERTFERALDELLDARGGGRRAPSPQNFEW